MPSVTTKDEARERVEEMLRLQERRQPLRDAPSEERAEVERRVAQVDRDIDEAVHALYGLTDAERRLVEGDELDKR